MFLAVGYAAISSCASRPLGAAYDSILLGDVEQEQTPSENGDREALPLSASEARGLPSRIGSWTDTDPALSTPTNAKLVLYGRARRRNTTSIQGGPAD